MHCDLGDVLQLAGSTVIGAVTAGPPTAGGIAHDEMRRCSEGVADGVSAVRSE